MIKTHKGEKFITTEGYTIEVVEYHSFTNCTIRFDSGLIFENMNFNQVKKGNVKNPYHKTTYGVGYFGVGKYLAKINGVRTKYYEAWRGMFRRCYGQETRFSSYKDVTVCEEWHNFQVFAEWFAQNYTEDFELDKDILFKGNKIYSPETCCFVPNEVNKVILKINKLRGVLPIGVTKLGNMFISQCNNFKSSRHISSNNTPEEAFYSYKIFKEAHIKKVAEIWKDKIESNVYNALLNYKIEITD